jgi:metal-sulfur cluster biosynthetic enzyme
VKQIANYVHGFIMKKDNATQDTKEKRQAHILNKNQKVMTANLLKVIVKLGLIKAIDAHIIEHD